MKLRTFRRLIDMKDHDEIYSKFTKVVEKNKYLYVDNAIAAVSECWMGILAQFMQVANTCFRNQNVKLDILKYLFALLNSDEKRQLDVPYIVACLELSRDNGCHDFSIDEWLMVTLDRKSVV